LESPRDRLCIAHLETMDNCAAQTPQGTLSVHLPPLSHSPQPHILARHIYNALRTTSRVETKTPKRHLRPFPHNRQFSGRERLMHHATMWAACCVCLSKGRIVDASEFTRTNSRKVGPTRTAGFYRQIISRARHLLGRILEPTLSLPADVIESPAQHPSIPSDNLHPPINPSLKAHNR